MGATPKGSTSHTMAPWYSAVRCCCVWQEGPPTYWQNLTTAPALSGSNSCRPTECASLLAQLLRKPRTQRRPAAEQSFQRSGAHPILDACSLRNLSEGECMRCSDIINML